MRWREVKKKRHRNKTEVEGIVVVEGCNELLCVDGLEVFSE